VHGVGWRSFTEPYLDSLGPFAGRGFPEHLEFYHDQTGGGPMTREQLVTAIKQNICGKVQPVHARLQRAVVLDRKHLNAHQIAVRDRGKRLACAEVSIVSGKHKNARLSEGPFVRKVVRMIEKSVGDPRIGQRKCALRSLRLESMHVFCLWLKVDRAEYFIPVTSSSAFLKARNWISRRELTKGLRSEAQRISASQERMSHLLRTRQG